MDRCLCSHAVDWWYFEWTRVLMAVRVHSHEYRWESVYGSIAGCCCCSIFSFFSLSIPALFLSFFCGHDHCDCWTQHQRHLCSLCPSKGTGPWPETSNWTKLDDISFHKNFGYKLLEFSDLGCQRMPRSHRSSKLLNSGIGRDWLRTLSGRMTLWRSRTSLDWTWCCLAAAPLVCTAAIHWFYECVLMKTGSRTIQSILENRELHSKLFYQRYDIKAVFDSSGFVYNGFNSGDSV